MEMEINPYAAPQSQVLQATSHDERIREEHIKTEATIKSIGLLFYLAAFVLVAVCVSLLAGSAHGMTGGTLLGGGICVLLTFGVGATAYGLRRLRGWARIPAIVISTIVLIIGLINLSLGVIIHIYILAKLMGKEARFIMTPEYQRIIAATPHVKYKTSILVKVLLALLLILLIGIIVAASFSK